MADLAHSPKGASSAERWMNCPGSAVLLAKLTLPETDEPEYRGLGIAAHEAAHACLTGNLDSWEIVGQKFHGYEVGEPGPDAEGKERVDFNAIQTYLGDVRQFIKPGVTVLVEQRIGNDPARRPHPDFYGTVDFAAYGPEELVVEDYKHGEGIVVEPEENAQMMYYAYGIIHDRTSRGASVRSDRVVRLRICQPRAYHPDGPIREWETTVGEIVHWAENELMPAMSAAEIDNKFDAGKWCRFCPAKLYCPLLNGLFGAAAKANPEAIPNFSSERLGLEYMQREAVKFYMKALEDETYRRNMTGNTVPHTKLVQKRANRVFRAGADDFFKSRFGASALSAPELKSPAEMEKIEPAAKALVKEWAYLPNTGLTVALESDTKPAVKVEKVVDIFAHMADVGSPQE